MFLLVCCRIEVDVHHSIVIGSIEHLTSDVIADLERFFTASSLRPFVLRDSVSRLASQVDAINALLARGASRGAYEHWVARAVRMLDGVVSLQLPLQTGTLTAAAGPSDIAKDLLLQVITLMPLVQLLHVVGDGSALAKEITAAIVANDNARQLHVVTIAEVAVVNRCIQQ